MVGSYGVLSWVLRSIHNSGQCWRDIPMPELPISLLRSSLNCTTILLLPLPKLASFTPSHVWVLRVLLNNLPVQKSPSVCWWTYPTITCFWNRCCLFSGYVLGHQYPSKTETELWFFSGRRLTSLARDTIRLIMWPKLLTTLLQPCHSIDVLNSSWWKLCIFLKPCAVKFCVTYQACTFSFGGIKYRT